ncbi:MAG: response regulator [Ktedonobacteraceae bacterium]
MQKKQPISGQTSEKTILIVDDDSDIGETLCSIILDQTNYRALWIAESDLALEAAFHVKPALILLDYMMPTLNGLQLFDYMQRLEHMRGVPVVLISAKSSLPFEQMRKKGIHFLPKPFELDEILNLVKTLVGDGK